MNEELGCVTFCAIQPGLSMHCPVVSMKGTTTKYLQGALKLVESRLSLGSHHDDFEVV